MTVAFRQEQNNSLGGSGTSVATGTFSSSLQAGNVLLVYVAYYSTQTTVTLSGAGQVNADFTAETVRVGGGGSVMHCFWCQNIAGGTTAALTATLGVSSAFPEIWVAEISGAPTTGARLAFVSNDGTVTNTTDGVSTGGLGTLSSQPALIVGICTDDSGSNVPAAGTGFTAGAALFAYNNVPNDPGTSGRSEWMRVTSTASVAATWTPGNTNHHHEAAWAIAEAGGGGGGSATIAWRKA